MDIQCIVFDVGWTLVDETEAHRYRMAHVLRACDPAMELTVDRLMEMYAEVAGEFHGDPLLPLLDRLGIPRERRDEFPYGRNMERVYPDAVSAVCSLQDFYKLGVLANQSAGLPQRMASYGFTDCFDFIIGSGDVGFRKPDRAIYDLAIQRTGFAPGEMLMVGDRLDNDIAPAKALGWRTARVLTGIHRGKKPETPDEVPDIEAESLGKLALMLYPRDDSAGLV